MLLKIVSGAFTGTTVMTLFSNVVSNQRGKLFKEPVLLTRLLDNSGYVNQRSVPEITGWIIHYSTGLFFVICYHIVWHYTSAEPSILSGSLLGLANGFIGIAGWSLVFHLNENPISISQTSVCTSFWLILFLGSQLRADINY